MPGRLARTTHRAVAILEEFGVKHAITGAVACAAYDYLRLTNDVDILVLASGDEWERVVREFTRRGFIFRGDDIHKLGMALLKTPECFGVDLIVEDDEEVFERAMRIEHLGGELAVASLEDVIRSKLRFRRGKDMSDLEALLNLHANRIDWGYLERKVADPDERDLLDRLRRGEKVVVEIRKEGAHRKFCE